MVYAAAARQFNDPLPADQLVQAKLALESVEKMSFIPKTGPSKSDPAAEHQKIVNVAKEIKLVLERTR